jgi:hypothetical protein
MGLVYFILSSLRVLQKFIDYVVITFSFTKSYLFSDLKVTAFH